MDMMQKLCMHACIDVLVWRRLTDEQWGFILSNIAIARILHITEQNLSSRPFFLVFSIIIIIVVINKQNDRSGALPIRSDTAYLASGRDKEEREANSSYARHCETVGEGTW